MAKITVTTGTPTRSTMTSIGANGIDVDFTLDIDGEETEGGATLLPCADGRKGYDTWGDLSAWLDGSTVARLWAIEDEETRREAINAIRVEVIEAADSSGIEPHEHVRVAGEDVVLDDGEDGYIVATCEALGAVSQGRTRAEALRNVREAIEVSR